MRLAAHLCGNRVNEVLDGDLKFVYSLFARHGFRRFQINATAVNGVDTSRLAEQWVAVRDAVVRCPQMEFILQRNAETEPLVAPLVAWIEGLEAAAKPRNISFLFDSSCGLGVLGKSWPVAPPRESGVRFGYAGGLGPSNLTEQLSRMAEAAPGREIWVDMESSLRTVDAEGKDIFDLDKCRTCIAQAVALRLIR
jgi:phosphoribosylanthranilate isomerase